MAFSVAGFLKNEIIKLLITQRMHLSLSFKTRVNAEFINIKMEKKNSKRLLESEQDSPSSTVY